MQCANKTLKIFNCRILLFSILIISPLLISGCRQSSISETEYVAIWQMYSCQEFEEGFFEKLSMEQKNKILRDVIQKTKIDLSAFAAYMNEHHPNAGASIFE